MISPTQRRFTKQRLGSDGEVIGTERVNLDTALGYPSLLTNPDARDVLSAHRHGHHAQHPSIDCPACHRKYED